MPGIEGGHPKNFQPIEHDLALPPKKLRAQFHEAHFEGVGQESRHLDAIRFQTALRSRSSHIRPMRIVAAEPEIERVAFGTSLHEVVEVLELRAGGVPGAPARFEPANGPGTFCALAVETDDATGLARQVGAVRLGGKLEETKPAFWG